MFASLALLSLLKTGAGVKTPLVRTAMFHGSAKFHGAPARHGARLFKVQTVPRIPAHT